MSADQFADDLVESVFRPREVDLAPGVRGIVDYGRVVTVFWLRAEPEGVGAVARWLDALPTDRRVRVICVTSDRLAGMLTRRGFVERQVSSPHGDMWVPAYVRSAWVS